MPLGASITFGEGSTDGNGYRLRLRELLEAQGARVVYVGSVGGGLMSNNTCEAYPGLTTSEVDARLSLSRACAYMPNVVLIHLGTNDCLAQRQDLATASDRFATLLGHLQLAVPDALVAVSSLVGNRNPGFDACIARLNAKLEGVATIAGDAGQKVVFVDMYRAVALEHISSDGTHPNDAGYAAMAEKWCESLMGVQGLISEPDARGKTARMCRVS